MLRVFALLVLAACVSSQKKSKTLQDSIKNGPENQLMRPLQSRELLGSNYEWLGYSAIPTKSNVYVYGENHKSRSDGNLKTALLYKSEDKFIYVALEGLVRNRPTEVTFGKAYLGINRDPGFLFGIEDWCQESLAASLLAVGYNAIEMESTSALSIAYAVKTNADLRARWNSLGRNLSGGGLKIYTTIGLLLDEVNDLKDFVLRTNDNLANCSDCLSKSAKQDFFNAWSLLQLDLGCSTFPIDPETKEKAKKYIADPLDSSLQSFIVENINGIWRDQSMTANIISLAKKALKNHKNLYVVVGSSHLPNIEKQINFLNESKEIHFVFTTDAKVIENSLGDVHSSEREEGGDPM